MDDNDRQMQLEWARRKIADYITDINTTQVALEEVHRRVCSQLSFVRKVEEHLSQASLTVSACLAPHYFANTIQGHDCRAVTWRTTR